MREQVINAINEFYKTNPQQVEMSFVALAKTLNLDYNNENDKNSLDKILRQLQADRFIICTLPADNVLYQFKKF